MTPNETMVVPLPRSTTQVFNNLPDKEKHPGLTLDKYATSWDVMGKTDGLSERVQRPMVEQIVKLSKKPPEGINYPDLFARWCRTLGKHSFTATTSGPMTLHLARASALENAGICLHRIYGFTYLPGTGLKGLARSFAEIVWLPAQSDPKKAWQQIEQVFGWAPGSDQLGGGVKPWKPAQAEEHGPNDSAHVGQIIFHDAWPEAWPELVVDILNNHHSNYYSKGEPPGDWEAPIPVNFLSVKPGTKFRFAVAPRRDDTDPRLLELAMVFLKGGLSQLGSGAKTASGYGDFLIDDKFTPIVSKARPTYSTTLELVTPAFLAGADQTDPSSCELRPATLRGQLRWWWRTMHAGYVTIEQLQQLEASVWGDTNRGGPVRVIVRPIGKIVPYAFDRNTIIRREGLPKPPNNKTTQGLTYHSYGMDEKKGGTIVRRHYLDAGCKWEVIISARGPQADLLLEQAKSALQLLCRYGGVGSKSRKGFGSFADLPDFNLAKIKDHADQFREAMGIKRANFSPALAQSPCLEIMLPELSIPVGGKNYWLALDQLAASAQAFAQKYKHDLTKKALGLPRNVRPPITGKFRAGRHVTDRHSSPALYHFAKDANGNLVMRMGILPAAELPTLKDSSDFLKELRNHIQKDLPLRFQQFVAGKSASSPPPQTSAAKPSNQGQLANGQRVKAKVIADPKDQGRPFAEIEGLRGNILKLPAGVTLEIGQEVELIINSVNYQNNQIMFRWPT